MQSTDEIVEAGFAALRGAQPERGPAELKAAVRRQAVKGRINQCLLALAGCIGIGVTAAIAMKPTSALAALRESARLSAAQPIVHLRMTMQYSRQHATAQPWPPVPTLDIWRFSDHYVRKTGHTICVLYKNGKMLAYDDRFNAGYRSTYDAKNDRFWTFDGTIGIELSGQHKDPPKVKDVVYHGNRYLTYEWNEPNVMQSRSTTRIYVDPQSKLVRFTDYDDVSANGDTGHSSTTVDYPSASAADRQAPRFPAGLTFRTKEEIFNDFNTKIGHAEQSKMLGGIRTTLFGVVISPNVPDGLGIEVVTQGGAGPDFGSGNQPEVLGSQLLPVKRSDWYPPFSDAEHTCFGRIQVLGGRKYIVNQSDNLLERVPSKITVRVPVWRLAKSTMIRDGKNVHPHEFVGFVTFTTSKIFSHGNEGNWSFYGGDRS